MNGFEDFFFHILIQLVVIIAAARLGGWIMVRLGQPQVVGEIMAGLLLGPSFLGQLAPGLVEHVFTDDTAALFRAFSELGLMLLMFLIGLDFNFSHLRDVGRTAAWVAGAGILIPFSLAAALALWIHPQVAPEADRTGFVLIVAIAMSITAIPILGRIMMELKIQHTRMATLTITAAAVDDVLGWILLAGASAAIHGNFKMIPILSMIGLTVVFILICRWVIRPFMNSLIQRTLVSGQLQPAGLAMVLIVVLLCGAATNAIGIFAIFGPFVLGAFLSDIHDFRDSIRSKLNDFVLVFFLPIFFTYTGLRTNLALLEGWHHWSICGLILLIATVGKMGGCGLAARLGGMNWRDSGCVAVMMNTRALMGLIAINIGRDLGVIPDAVFSMLVIMALATTLFTLPLLRRLLTHGTDATLGYTDRNASLRDFGKAGTTQIGEALPLDADPERIQHLHHVNRS